MKLLDNITGKSKLIDDIHELKTKINKYSLQIKEKENKISILRQEFSIKTEKFSFDIREKEEEIKLLRQQNKKITDERSKLEQNVLEKDKSLALKEVELSNLIKELDRKESVITEFQKSYGELIIEEKHGDSYISEYDEDKSFFDLIKPKNGNNDFNNDQVQAIRYDMENHLRIIAGAGSGKTQTICAKAAYLVMMKNVPQDKIAMFTFTAKAAEEMKERVQDFLDERKVRLSIGTFHSIFQVLYNDLKNRFPYVKSMGINGGDPIQGEKQYKKLLNNLIKKYELNQLNENGEKSLFEKMSYWTNMGYCIEEMVTFVEKHYDQLEPLSCTPISKRFLAMMSELQLIRKEENIVIFDDYLINLLHVLQKDDDARVFVQHRFQYIFIDEFQDTNPLQMKIINQICPPEKAEIAKLIIVGDDDQSIYFFRGAEPKYIKNFDSNYRTHTQKLMTNYRSIARIVQAGNRLISYNSGSRIQKSMIPFHNNEGDCFIQVLPNQVEEAEWIIKKVAKLGLVTNTQEPKITPDYKKSVLLYRSNAQIKTILHQLELNNIPFVIEANDDLMGIFNIDEFKKSFKYWGEFVDEEVNKIYKWNNIVAQTAYAFYKKKSDVERFITDKNKFTNPYEAAEFICGKKNIEKKKIVYEYLAELVNLKKNIRASSMNVIINNLLKFPLLENELTKEEVKWIQLEAEEFKTWEQINTRYGQLEKKKDEMRKKLQEYRQGIYNAFYLLTIHKSKGLSFENVFVVGVYDGGLPHKRAKKLDSEFLESLIEQAEPPTTIEEERRLIYVAITRAKKNLYLTFPATINDKPINRSIFLKETGLSIKKK